MRRTDVFPQRIASKGCDTVVSDLLDPTGILLADSMFIVSEPDRDPMISSYDRAGNRLRGFLHKGHGPGETRDLLRISLYSNPVVQAPVDPETVFLYDLDGLSDGNALPCAEYRLPAGNYAFSSIHAFAENKVLYAGKSTRHRNGSDRRFRIYDADSDELLAFGDYPPEDAAAGFDIADLEKAAIERSVFYRYPSIEAIYVPQLKVHAIRRDPDAPSGFPNGRFTEKNPYLGPRLRFPVRHERTAFVSAPGFSYL